MSGSGVTVVTFGAVWALCLLGVGCQAQVSYRFINPLKMHSAELADEPRAPAKRAAPIQRVSADEDGGSVED